jgi:hypothetical protein
MSRSVIASPLATPAALLLGALLLLGACASDDYATGRPALAPAQLVHEITATAQVTAVDAATRLVTLRREDGNLIQVVAGDEVVNFDQIDVGDVLRVRFQDTLTASLCPPGETELGALVGALAARAEPGAKPGIQTDEGRRFVKGLRIGDVVQLDFAGAVALTIEEV